MLSGWTAVLPKLQEDSSRFTVTVQDVTWLASLNLIVGIGVCPLAGTLGEHVGPCRLLFLAMFPVPVFWLIKAYTPWLPLLYVCRAALAISTSILCTMVQPLIAELCPAEIRGLAGTLPEVMGCAGILLSYVLAYLLPWDVATAVSAAPFVPLVLLMLLVPESPYWLVRKKRIDAAERSLRVLLGRSADVTKELDAIRSTTTLKQSKVKNQVSGSVLWPEPWGNTWVPCRLLFLAMFPVPVFWLIKAYTPWLPLLYVCRAALAISTSILCTMVQPLIAELCPPRSEAWREPCPR
ncbi:facilitated trehalose transporter Tret1-like [Penaeus indicus]|uniref:facilitated trehalose transporter Tret1-like n=1 Tax=Penaeus indicus TaxID=29960 RepID=UPI00300C1A60